MMKKKCLTVPLVNFEDRDLDTALELEGARFDVNCVNWPAAFPYAPLCSGRIARTEDALVVDFPRRHVPYSAEDRSRRVDRYKNHWFSFFRLAFRACAAL